MEQEKSAVEFVSVDLGFSFHVAPRRGVCVPADVCPVTAVTFPGAVNQPALHHT